MAKKKMEQNKTLTEYILQNADKTAPADWLEKMAQNMKNCRLATHIGKFTHPDSKVALLTEPGAPDAGYVTTQSCQCPVDVQRDAKMNKVGKLLLLDMPDGRKLFNWAEKSSENLRQELESNGFPAEPLIQSVQQTVSQSRNIPKSTDGNLRQVYFPVSAEHQYHLLTILPASSLLLEMKQRLRTMNTHYYHCHSNKAEEYGENCEYMPNLTEVKFGGTQAINISHQNLTANGTAYLLSSLPPVWTIKKVRLPKKDFFQDGALLVMAKEHIQRLHHLFLLDWNNLKIREGIRFHADMIADAVAGMAEQMRAEPEGWSREESFAELPESQKIWLDESYREQRLSDERWIDEVSTAFGRWLIYAYSRIAGQEKVGLGDEELQFFKNRLTDVLKEEVRLEK